MEGTIPNPKELACPDAAVADPADVEARKAKRVQLNAPKVSSPWLVLPEEIAIAGVDYPADPADPFYDERSLLPLDPAMVADIDANGVIEIITCVKDGEVPKVKAGHRRTMHARAANLLRKRRGDPPLRVRIILDGGDPKSIFLSSRRSNAFRADDGVLQKARNAKRAIEHFGATEKEVAASEGAHIKTVREWLAILNLSADALQAIEAGQISPSGALMLLEKVPRKDQPKVLAEELAKAGGHITTRAAEAGRKNLNAAAASASPPLPASKPAAKESAPKEKEPAPPTSGDAEAAPTRTTTRQLLKAYDSGDVHMEIMDSEAITEGFMLGVRWSRGDVSRKSVKGLSKALRGAGVKVG